MIHINTLLKYSLLVLSVGMLSSPAQASLVRSVGMLSSPAQAAETGTVSFNGNIIATPCTVTTANPNVPLGNVPASTLHGAPKRRSALVEFTIGISNCGRSNMTSVVVEFDGVNNSGGLVPLSSVSGVATGVGIRLLGKDDSVIDLGTTPADNYSTQVSLSKSAVTSGTFTFKAAYESTGANVTPGTANGTVSFKLTYL